MTKQEYYEKLLQRLDELLLEQSGTQSKIRRVLRELWNIKITDEATEKFELREYLSTK